MDLRLISHVLFLRAAWRKRDHWDAARIAAHQDHALKELRHAAYAGSEFYRHHHAGLHDAPLDHLPPVTKADLMEHFDEAITGPGLRLAELEDHLRSLSESHGDPGVPVEGRVVGSGDGRDYRSAGNLRVEPQGMGHHPGQLRPGQ
ncbi:hypothetical protein [Pseudarthrobacter siccitolerans]